MLALTIVVIISIFVLENTLIYLNYSYKDNPIPKNVDDIYDTEEYTKWLSYTMERRKISIFENTLGTMLIIAFLLTGLFPYIASFSSQFSNDKIIQSLIFFLIYYLISYFLSIGFKVYRTFVIEEKYGFNRTTKKTFFIDQVKSILLNTVLGGGVLFILLLIYQSQGRKFVFYGWLTVILISLVANILYTKVFIKLFNKLTPLPEGPLYEKINKLAEKTGYEVKKISIMDASKRSSRLNAFFSGFGKFKHIVLYDTLLEKCTENEIIAILAHEIGHDKNKDVLKNFMLSTVQLSLFIAIMTFFLESSFISKAFGFANPHYGFSIILFGILIEPISIVLGVPLSYISRKAEYKADAYAAKEYNKEDMISALKVLSKENFSNLNPHPLVVKLTYSHPPVSERIKSIE
jgi:STE24 endopeptidase